MAKRDLNLNSLGRYGKKSDQLILEEFSHCEVPAGCGGAVLRWRHSNTGLMFLFRVYVQGKYSFFLDGQPTHSSLTLVPFGDHVISLALTELIPGDAVMAFSAIHDEDGFQGPRVSRTSGQKVGIFSAGDGNWKYSAAKPAENSWMVPGFDDSGWLPMIQRDTPDLGKQQYLLNGLMKEGAQCIGTREAHREAHGEVWVRRAFSVKQVG